MPEKHFLNSGRIIKMKLYIVQITDEALQNMEEIYNYVAIELLAPDAAMNLYNKIADEIMKLNYLPDKIRIMDSEPEDSRQIRRMLVDNYSIFYVIKGDQVIVTNVLYSASNISKRLKD